MKVAVGDKARGRKRRTVAEQTNDILIGLRVRQARLEAGVSQEQLGRQLGISYQQLQKNETGLNRISVGRLKRIAELLDKPLSYFLEVIELPSDELPGSMTPRMQLQLMRYFLQIQDSTLREKLLATVRAFAESEARGRGDEDGSAGEPIVESRAPESKGGRG